MLVKEIYIKGLRFKIYLDGTVVDLKSYAELGYLNENVVKQLLYGNYERVAIDKVVQDNLKLPHMIKDKVYQYFRKIRKSISKKKFCPKKECPISLSDFEKYANELTELQKEVLNRIMVHKQSGLTVSQSLGIHKMYVYKIKSDAVKKIVALKTVNNL